VARTRGRGDIIPMLWSIVGRVKICLLWCIVGVVGAAAGQINMPQLYYCTSGDLHDDSSDFMAMCDGQSFRLTSWFSRCSLDQFLDVSPMFVVICDSIGGRDEVVSLER
jgi:hypothetical protein